MLATPVETVARSRGEQADVRRVLQIAAEIEAVEIIVGLPLSLGGTHTASTADAIGFAGALADGSPTPVRLVDERLSTVSALSAVHASGRTTKSTRSVIDQVAATIILQHALDLERASGRAPGHPVEPNGGTSS